MKAHVDAQAIPRMVPLVYQGARVKLPTPRRQRGRRGRRSRIYATPLLDMILYWSGRSACSEKQGSHARVGTPLGEGHGQHGLQWRRAQRRQGTGHESVVLRGDKQPAMRAFAGFARECQEQSHGHGGITGVRTTAQRSGGAVCSEVVKGLCKKSRSALENRMGRSILDDRHNPHVDGTARRMSPQHVSLGT